MLLSTAITPSVRLAIVSAISMLRCDAACPCNETTPALDRELYVFQSIDGRVDCRQAIGNGRVRSCAFDVDDLVISHTRVVEIDSLRESSGRNDEQRKTGRHEVLR